MAAKYGAAGKTILLDGLSDLQRTWLKLSGESDRIANFFYDVSFTEVTTDSGCTRWQLTGHSKKLREFQAAISESLKNFDSECARSTDIRVFGLQTNPAVQEMLQKEALLRKSIEFQKQSGGKNLLLCQSETNSLLVFGRFAKEGQSKSPVDCFLSTFAQIVDSASFPVDSAASALLASREWQNFLARFPPSAELCFQLRTQEPQSMHLAALCYGDANESLKIAVEQLLAEYQVVKDKCVPCPLHFIFALEMTVLLKDQYQQLVRHTCDNATVPTSISMEVKAGVTREMGVYFSGCLSDFRAFKLALISLSGVHLDFDLSNGCFNFPDKLAVIRCLFNDSVMQQFLSQCEQKHCAVMYYVEKDGKLSEYCLLSPPVAKTRQKVALNNVFTLCRHPCAADSKTVTVQTFVNSNDAIDYDETRHMNSDLCVELVNDLAPNAADVELPETSTPLVRLGVLTYRHGYFRMTNRTLVTEVETLTTYCDDNEVCTLTLLVRKGFAKGVCNLMEKLCKCCSFEQLNVLCTSSDVASDIVYHLQKSKQFGGGGAEVERMSKNIATSHRASFSIVSSASPISESSKWLRSASVPSGGPFTLAFSTSTPNGLAIEYSLGDLATERSDVIVLVAYVGFGRRGNCKPQGALMQSLFAATGKYFVLQDFQPFLTTKATMNLTEMQAGDVWQSAAGNLACRKLVLIALPHSKDASFRRIFDQTLVTVLNGCVTAGYDSLSLPLIGTGALGLSAKDAATCMMYALNCFEPQVATSRKTTVLAVRIVGHRGNRIVANEYEKTMRQYKLPLSQFTNSSEASMNDRCKVNGVILRAVVYQITNANVDAIVNSTNLYLNMTDGLSQAMLAAGNPDLQTAVQQVGCMRTDDGYPYATTSGTFGSLKCKHVIHVLLPKTVADIRQAVIAIVKEVNRLQCATVAMPAIGTGAGKLPADQVADALVNQLVLEVSAGRAKGLQRVFLTLHEAADLPHFKLALQRECLRLPSAVALRTTAQNEAVSLKLSLVALQQAKLDVCCHELQTLLQTNLSSKEFSLHNAVNTVPKGTLKRLAETHFVTIHVASSSEPQVPVRINGRLQCIQTCYAELLETVAATKSLNAAKTMQRQAQWEYKVVDSAVDFVAYDVFANQSLEQAYLQQMTDVQFTRWCNDSLQRVKVDLRSMQEVVLTTANVTASVRRVPCEAHVNNCD